MSFRAGALCSSASLAVQLLACGPDTLGDAPPPAGVTALANAQIPSVLQVNWTTARPSQGYVAYGTTPDLGLTTPLEGVAATTHSLGLLGLAPETDYFYRVFTWDGDAAASPVQAARTGALTLGMLPTTAGAGFDQYTLSAVNGQASRVVITSPTGQVVWAYADPAARPIGRALFSRDGKYVIYSASPEPAAAGAELVRVALDGSNVAATPVPNLTGDFAELPDGSVVALVAESRDFGGTPLRGDALVQVGADGALATLWSSWDCFDPASVPGDDMAQAWTLANAVDYDSVADAFLIGLRNFSSITKVTRDGQCEWVLGQHGSTLAFAVGSEPFVHQSQFQLLGDRLVVFDDEGSAAGARVIEYQLDLGAGTATQLWVHSAPAAAAGAASGEPTRLIGNATLVNWGRAGLYELVSQAGESVFTATFGEGLRFGDLAKDIYATGQ